MFQTFFNSLNKISQWKVDQFRTMQSLKQSFFFFNRILVLGLVHSREYPKNHSREYRKNHKSFPGIPGNGNENFFLRKKKPIFYVLQRFTLSFHVWSIVLGKHFKESLPKRLRILVEKSPVSKFRPLCTGGRNLRSEFWLEIKILLTKLTSGNTKMASEV